MRGTFDWLLTLAHGAAFANEHLNEALELFDDSDGDWGEILKFTFSERSTDHPQEQMIRLYLAFFDRLPDATGLEFWTSRMTGGMRAQEIAENFVQGDEFKAKFGAPSNEGFVRLAYQNVFQREPDAGGLEFWVGRLDDDASPASVMTSISQGDELGVIRRADFIAARTLLNLFGEGAHGTLAQWSAFLRENPGEAGEADFFAQVAEMDVFTDLIEAQRPDDNVAFINAVTQRLLDRSFSEEELLDAQETVGLNEKSHAEWTTDQLESDEFLVTLGPVFRLYQAYFLRYPDLGGLEHWSWIYGRSIAEMGADAALVSLSEQFLVSDEFTDTYGDLDNRGFIALIYDNVLRRSADEEGLAFWTGRLDAGTTRAALMVRFSESEEYLDLLAAEQLAYFAGVFLSEDPYYSSSGWVRSWGTYFEMGGDRSELVHQLLAEEDWAENW